MANMHARQFTDGRSLVGEWDIRPSGVVYRNAGIDTLYQAAVQRGQATVLANGALLQGTGPFYGRAAKSSFYVNDPDARFNGKGIDDLIAWGNPAEGQWDNLPMDPAVYRRLRARVVARLSEAGDLYVNDGWSGRTERSRMGVRLITESAVGAVFAHNIFLRLQPEELAGFKPEWTILQAPSVKAEPADKTHSEAFIIVDLAAQVVVIGGTKYNGQIKKSMFCVQNFRLPLKGILTMHAGASEGEGGLSAVHAGLSGTGKTTLSNTGFPVADDQIVVDTHSDDPEAVISNMEGGQYAKTENLKVEKEPETFNAILYGTTAENIWHDEQGVVDYDNTSITANGRVGYPLEFVPTAKASGLAKAPANITFLTADGYGVLPPVARLSVEGGKFHFAMGFTSKMPGTEKGITEPQPTFSAFFGKPFMPLKPVYYMDLLADLIKTHGTQVWLVNTGWLGPNEPGRGRVDILVSKAIINAVRDNKIDLSDDNFWFDPVFKLQVPKAVPGVDAKVLDPRNFWADADAYQAACNKLAGIFQTAAGKLPDMPADVLAAGPAPR
ncbi:MAG: phosphoenolpyruvate carboxykinase (ATP) [Myxococcales bacterium]|nr:phosphoenolpyruvate carboxykinase (ATP) [Myxococcales bacterium]